MAKNGKQKDKPAHQTQPSLPYTNTPGSLRKFLTLVPQKPKPAKINNELLSAWQLGGNNANSILRVLKAVHLIADNNAPTEGYATFMSAGKGPLWLAAQLREVYAPFFEAHHLPHKENDEALRRLFNIHSGGAEGTISFQVQTFKALCDHADFTAASSGNQSSKEGLKTESTRSGESNTSEDGSFSVHVDLHIHLPENKTRRDYEYMFEDIARYIYGRKGESDDEK